MSDECEYLCEKEKWLKKHAINVQELIEILKKYPQDIKVMTTWESTLHALEENNIYISSTGNLYIDADENFYKNEFMSK